MVSASMPATRARSRPPAFALLEITTAICAGRRPSLTASMSACRLLPRPEIRTPIRGASDVPDSLAAIGNPADADRAGFARGGELREQGVDVVFGARDDQADPHVEGPEHVGLGDAARGLQPAEDRGTLQPPTATPAGDAGRQDLRQVPR